MTLEENLAACRSAFYPCKLSMRTDLYRPFCGAGLALVCVLVSACVSVPHKQDDGVVPQVYRWQDESLALIQKYQLNPLRATRILAALHGGLLEIRDSSASLSPACRTDQIDAAAAAILEHFFPLETPGRLRAMTEMRKRVATGCSMEQVTRVVSSIQKRAETDGAFPPRRIRVNPNPFVGDWKPTAPLFMNTPAEPYAGEWRMYFSDNPAAYPIKGPISPNSTAYAEALREVMAVARTLTPEQARAADDWHLDAGSVTPPGVWNQRLRAMLRDAPPGTDAVRLLAVANQTMHDAMIVCWHYKYRYWTERPITAAARLGLGSFTPRLVTPPFPSYPSGHSAVSGAVATVISAYLPEKAAEADRLAREAADSRLWGGIHFTFDNDDGLALGKQVGAAAIRAMPPAPRPSR